MFKIVNNACAGFAILCAESTQRFRVTMAIPRKPSPGKTRLPVRPTRGHGGPAIEDAWTLLEIWLFVQENAHRTLFSVNAICNHGNAMFQQHPSEG